MSNRNPLLALVVVAMVLGTLGTAPAAAHESTTVEGYELTFGGADEPVITGERMWLEIEIVDNETGEPVEGQADSLNVSLQQSGGEKVAWDVSEKHGDAGVYEAAVIFTEPGDYIVHVEGTIEETEVHTHFEKEVHDSADLEFPPSDDSDDADDSDGNDVMPDLPTVDPAIAAGIAAVAFVTVGVAVLRR